MLDFDLRHRLRFSPRQQRFQRRCACRDTPGFDKLASRALLLQAAWPECAPCRARSGGVFSATPPCNSSVERLRPAVLPQGWRGPSTWPTTWTAPVPDGWTGPPSIPQGWSRGGLAPPPGVDPLADAGGARFAINTPKFGHADDLGEEGYGDDPMIAADLASLGVGVARHPGRIQMFYSDIMGGRPIPLSFRDIATDIIEVGALAAKLDRLGSLIRRMHARGGIDFKLVITLLTLGSADGSPDYDLPPDRDFPINLAWDPAHVGRSGYDDFGRLVSFDTVEGTTTYSGWDLNTLDPSSGYKRAYLRAITTVVASSISDLADALRTDHGIDITDYVEGFEIGNEIETKQLVPTSPTDDTPTNDSQGWGALYAAIASAFLDEAPWATLFLPGLQAFGDDSDDAWARWAAKPAFVEDALVAARTELAAMGSGYTLDDIVGGIDIHYYHGNVNRVRSLAYLYADVTEIRGVLADAAIQQAYVSVIESGINVACGDPDDSGTTTPTADGAPYDNACERTDGDWAYPSLVPATSRPARHRRPLQARCFSTPGGPTAAETGTEMGANDFQGASVWMRLAVALAAGAPVVGWHTLMAGLNTGFDGQGLRRDLHPMSREPASVAEQRPSWYAFSRMAHLLTGARSARLLSPDPSKIDSHGEIQDAEPLAWTDKVWVIEATDGPGIASGFAYLCFIDPFGTVPVAPGVTGDFDDAPRCATLTFSGTGLSMCRTRRTAPWSAARVPYGHGLPATIWVDNRPQDVAVYRAGGVPRFDVRLQRSRWPVLLFSPSALTLAGLTVDG